MRVFKFGGASVKDAEAVRNVANILQNYKGERLVIVVSAMGKTTNALERVVDAYYQKTGEAQAYLDELKQAHSVILGALFEANDPIFDTVNDTLVEIEWVLEEEPEESYDYIYDQIVSIGEFLSTHIVSAYLCKVELPTTWLDARNVILTDNTYRAAKVEWEATVKNANRVVPPLSEKGFVMTQGFIGGTSENFTTTLGREGSDFTAAIFSYCLDVESMSVWKDVPGILTANPRIFKNVTKIDHLSYREAIEMTYYGAKVIHPKTIKPLQNKNIPMYVKSFVEPEGEGTRISGDIDAFYPPIIVVEKEQVLLHISTRNFSFVAEENLSVIFAVLAKHKLKVNMMQSTAISFSVCLTNEVRHIEGLMEDLREDFNITKQDNLELVTVRHYKPEVIAQLKINKLIILEAHIRDMVQMVVKDLPKLERIG